MKVVFSPNLHPSVYPGTSAFYCDRATCTRAERVHNMKDRLDRSCTLPIARFEYEWRDKEMKVVFSPNLHLSAYPNTSAFYCDRATCTRQESTKIKLSQLDHIPSIYPDPSAFYWDRVTCTRDDRVWAEKQGNESGLQSKSSSLRIPRNQCFLLRQSHMHEQRKCTKWRFGSTDHTLSPLGHYSSCGRPRAERIPMRTWIYIYR